MLIAAFVAIWVPYVTAVGLQERFGVEGGAGPAIMAASLLVALAAGWWLARRSAPNPFGLRFDRRTMPILVIGIGVMIVARWLAGHAAVAAGIASYEAPVPAGALVAGLAAALAIGAVPALTEDILTRGFPLFAARGNRPAWLLILVSALIYTLNHIWRFDWGLSEQVRLFSMGTAYAVAAWRFGSLWAAFALHLGWNAGSAVVPLDIADPMAFRLESAAIHLAIAVLILLLPKRQPDS